MHRYVPLLGFLGGCIIVSSSAGPEGRVPDGGVLDESSSASRNEVTRQLLRDTAERAIEPTYAELDTAAEALRAALVEYALDSSSPGSRSAAQDAWAVAMDAAQRAELLQIGPAAMEREDVIGGRGLREAVYSWPSFNRCRIDVVTSLESYADRATLRALPNFTRGLGAIEYLLFYQGTDHGCPAGAVVTVDDGVWSSLAPDVLRARKAAHALALAELVAEGARELLSAWRTEHREALANAGMAGSPYPTTQEALNSIYAALFFADRQLKDDKLNAPVAVPDCANGCAELLESRYAGRSLENVRANLEAIERLLLAGDETRTGWDDLLRAAGRGEAREQTWETEPYDASTLASRVDGVVELHAAVKRFTDVLKVELKTALDLELPMGAEGDND
jgi:uncharacterized protein